MWRHELRPLLYPTDSLRCHVVIYISYLCQLQLYFFICPNVLHLNNNYVPNSNTAICQNGGLFCLMNFLMNSISIGEDAPVWKTITTQSEMLAEITMIYLSSLAYPV